MGQPQQGRVVATTEVEAQRRSLQLGDAPDAGPDDARRLLELVDADANDTCATEYKLGRGPDAEVVLDPIGLGVWLPLAHEAAAVRELVEQGWAASPGERYRFQSASGIRITTADLEPDDAERLADAIAGLGRAPESTYTG